jgi:hypothetical protein
MPGQFSVIMNCGKFIHKTKHIKNTVRHFPQILIVRNDVINFISGTIFGIIVATIGFTPVANALNGIMFQIQKQSVEMNRPTLPPPTNDQRNQLL